MASLDDGVYILAIEKQAFFRIESNFFRFDAILRNHPFFDGYDWNGRMAHFG